MGKLDRAGGLVPVTPSDAHPGLPSPSALKAGRLGEMAYTAGKPGGVIQSESSIWDEPLGGINDEPVKGLFED